MKISFEEAITLLRSLRTPDHFCTSDECRAEQAALDLAIHLIGREPLIETLLDRQASHFFHPKVTSVDAVQAAAEAVRRLKPAGGT